MGYELHIERDEPNQITSEEWEELIENDDELEFIPENGEFFVRYLGDCEYGFGEGWFDWFEGSISTKNPDNAILSKMLMISEILGAKVRGDDGEIYTEPNVNAGKREKIIKNTRGETGLLERVYALLSRIIPAKNQAPHPFQVGDQVKDFSGYGTVVAINRRVEHGLGRISVRYDDGRVLHSAIDAHCYEKVSSNRDREPL